MSSCKYRGLIKVFIVWTEEKFSASFTPNTTNLEFDHLENFLSDILCITQLFIMWLLQGSSFLLKNSQIRACVYFVVFRKVICKIKFNFDSLKSSFI